MRRKLLSAATPKEAQSRANFDVFEELFDAQALYHTSFERNSLISTQLSIYRPPMQNS
jgi:hypothetical protein